MKGKTSSETVGTIIIASWNMTCELEKKQLTVVNSQKISKGKFDLGKKEQYERGLIWAIHVFDDRFQDIEIFKAFFMKNP